MKQCFPPFLNRRQRENIVSLEQNVNKYGVCCDEFFTMDLRKINNVALFKAFSGDDVYFRHLSANGCNVILVPPIDFEFFNIECLEEKLNQPEKYSGIILSSPRCVKAVQLASKLTTLTKWAQLPAFVVGETTDSDARALGLNCFGKDTGSAARLAELIISEKFEKHLLYPKSKIASDTLETALTKADVLLDSIEIYKTVPHPDLDQGLTKINLPAKFVFFSPSGVESVLPLLNASDFKNTQFYAIGETTEKALTSRGVTVTGTSSKPTPEALFTVLHQS